VKSLPETGQLVRSPTVASPGAFMSDEVVEVGGDASGAAAEDADGAAGAGGAVGVGAAPPQANSRREAIRMVERAALGAAVMSVTE